MLDGYKILTVTHRRTPLQIIGEFMVKTPDETALQDCLVSLKERFGIEELVYLSTCNRVTYILYTENTLSATFKEDFFEFINPNISKGLINSHANLFEGKDAADHLFKVAASIDSLVVGEREVLRQLREAYERCKDWELTGDYLRIIIQNSVIAAKEVYSTTKLGEKSVSVVSLAFKELLKTNLPKSARVLMVGAGQTNALVCKFLEKYGYNNVTVFNRSIDKAQKLAGIFNGKALTLDRLSTYEGGFDCMIVCTGATKSIINCDLYRKLVGKDKGKKVVIDLSIPNNVCKEVSNGEFDLHYIEIECLKALAKKNHSYRQREVVVASELLDRHLIAFSELVKNRRIERALHRIPIEVKMVRDRAMNQVFQKEVANLDENTRLLLDRMMNYMEKKCTGIPIKIAREALVHPA